MHRLFTYGPGREPAETKDTEIGEIPEHWNVVPLGQVVECLDHKRVPVRASDRAKRQGNVPYYGASGRIDWIDDYLFDEPLLLIAEDGANLVSRVLPIAYCISGKAWVNNHAHVLRVTGANMKLLETFINATGLGQYLTGTTRPKLNKANLMQIQVPQPPIGEQNLIASAISAAERKTIAQQDRKAALQALFRSMLHQLMTGRIRVKDLDL